MWGPEQEELLQRRLRELQAAPAETSEAAPNAAPSADAAPEAAAPKAVAPATAPEAAAPKAAAPKAAAPKAAAPEHEAEEVAPEPLPAVAPVAKAASPAGPPGGKATAAPTPPKAAAAKPVLALRAAPPKPAAETKGYAVKSGSAAPQVEVKARPKEPAAEEERGPMTEAAKRRKRRQRAERERAASGPPEDRQPQREWVYCPNRPCRRWFKSVLALTQHLHDYHNWSWDGAHQSALYEFSQPGRSSSDLGRQVPRTPPKAGPAEGPRSRSPQSVHAVDLRSNVGRDERPVDLRSAAVLDAQIGPGHSASQVGSVSSLGPSTGSMTVLSALLAVSDRILTYRPPESDSPGGGKGS